MKQKLIFTLVVPAVLFIWSGSFAQGITRGTEYNEFYYTSPWYFAPMEGKFYYGMFYSADNGETLELITYGTDPIEPDTIFVCNRN